MLLWLCPGSGALSSQAVFTCWMTNLSRACLVLILFLFNSIIILFYFLFLFLFYSLFDIDYYIDPGYFRLSDREVLMVVGHAVAKHKVFMERMECLDFSDENERISVENLQGVCPISPAGSFHYSASQSSGINGIQKWSSRWLEKKSCLVRVGVMCGHSQGEMEM